MHTVIKRSGLLQGRIFRFILTLLFLFNMGGIISKQYTNKNIIFFKYGGLINGLDYQRKSVYTISCDNLPYCSEAMCKAWNRPNVNSVSIIPNYVITEDSCSESYLDSLLRLWIGKLYSGNLFLTLQILWLTTFIFLILHILFSFNFTLCSIFYMLAKLSSIVMCFIFWPQISYLIMDYNISVLLITALISIFWCAIQSFDLFVEFYVLAHFREKLIRI